MNVQDAFYQTVHGAAGGCESLAVRLGMSSAILRNKANVHSVTNKPMLDDADRIMGITGDHSILHALAANHGYVCVRVPDDVDASDMAVLEMVTKVWTTNGEVGAEVNKALADGRITRREVEQVRAAVKRAERALEEVTARLAGMAEK
ncbi:MAG: phage regulatory CII family protein [Telluria sp.]